MIDWRPNDRIQHGHSTFPMELVMSRQYFSSASITSRLRTAIGRIRGNRGLNANMENRLASIRVQHEHDDDEEQGLESNARSATPRVRSAALSRLKFALLLLLIYAILWFILRFIRLSAAARVHRELLESGRSTISSSNPRLR